MATPETLRQFGITPERSINSPNQEPPPEKPRATRAPARKKKNKKK